MATNDDDFLAELHEQLDARQVSPAHMLMCTSAWGVLVLLWCVSQGLVP